LSHDAWVVVSREGRLLAPVDRLTTVDEVVHFLVRRAGFEGALALENQDATSRMRGGVALEVVRVATDGKVSTAEVDEAAGAPVFSLGDRLDFRITSTLKQPVFVTLLDFDPAGAIAALEACEQRQLAAGESFLVGEFSGGFEVNWAGDEATEWFKLFATVQQVDFRFLQRAGDATRVSAPSSALATDDWWTETRSIVIRPPS
jgi:hypothetical protein